MSFNASGFVQDVYTLSGTEVKLLLLYASETLEFGLYPHYGNLNIQFLDSYGKLNVDAAHRHWRRPQVKLVIGGPRACSNWVA